MENSVEKTPGRLAISTENEQFKTPVGIPMRRPKKKVMEEEDYVEEMGKIIQRDFFPDLEKLKAQNDYLDAMERNDVIRLRELHLKYSGRRPPTERIPSPATFETPANIHGSQTQPLNQATPNSGDHQTKTDGQEPRLTLDQYLNTHTSQDNESFEEILRESERKHRQKYAYLYNSEEQSALEQQKLLSLPSIEDQSKEPEKKFLLDSWGYKNRNYIMYVPDGVALTPEEEVERAKKKQEVVHANTRLVENPFNESQSKEAISEVAKTQAKVLDGKIGVDGKEIVIQSPKVGGYGFVATPSPSPRMLDSPLMTWGEIEGTPFRLDGSDTPLPRSQGPSFKMADLPKREQIAHALAEKAAEKNRDRKKKAMDAARRHFASPSPRPNTSTMERLATMSPAARKLAATKLKLATPQRGMLYTPSPDVRKTPGTPKSSGSVTTPKLNLGIRKSGIATDLTDDLLNINVPKRQKAADFF